MFFLVGIIYGVLGSCFPLRFRSDCYGGFSMKFDLRGFSLVKSFLASSCESNTGTCLEFDPESH